MSGDFKTVLTDALEVDPDYFEGKNGTRTILFDGDHLDRLAKAVTDHFLDREKVRAAIIAGMRASYHSDLPKVLREGSEATGFDLHEEHLFDDDRFITALIEGLTGGGSQ